jgi:hypothetical protein
MSRIKHFIAIAAAGLALAAALPIHAADRGEPYALVRDGERGTSMTGDSADWSAVKNLRKRINGDFLWFRDGGKPYIVQDAGVLARARAAWEPVEKLGKEMDVHGREMDRHGKAMGALGKDMERAAVGTKPDEAKMHAIERRMNDAGKPMDALGKQMDVLGKRMDAESRTADKTVRTLIREALDKGLAQSAPQA